MHLVSLQKWPDNGQSLSWSCNLHLASSPSTPHPHCPCLPTHKHTYSYHKPPPPSPRTLTLSASLTRKQAWVLGWSENIDLHKSMHCLLPFHHWPLQIHIWLLHIYTTLHAGFQANCTCMNAHIIGFSMLCLVANKKKSHIRSES